MSLHANSIKKKKYKNYEWTKPKLMKKKTTFNN